jgi:hypothetical protein
MFTEQARHICCHMEEIAFTVIPRAYEDWTFYSDSDDGSESEFLKILRKRSDLPRDQLAEHHDHPFLTHREGVSLGNSPA